MLSATYSRVRLSSKERLPGLHINQWVPLYEFQYLHGGKCMVGTAWSRPESYTQCLDLHPKVIYLRIGFICLPHPHIGGNCPVTPFNAGKKKKLMFVNPPSPPPPH